MMNCKLAQRKFSALLDGQLSEKEKTKVLAHINSCMVCKKVADEFWQLQEVVSSAISAREAPPQLEDRLFRQIADYEYSRNQSASILSVQGIKQALLLAFGRRTIRAVGACVAVVLVGLVISQLFLKHPGLTISEQPKRMAGIEKTDSFSQESFISPHIEEFLDKSSAILLEIKNSRIENPELYAPERNVARQLLNQADLIEPAPKNSQHYDLNRLVDDLEPILTDIANLDRDDQQSLDIIRNAIKRNGYLRKIDFVKTGQ